MSWLSSRPSERTGLVEEGQRWCGVIDSGASWQTSIARSPLEPVHLLRGRVRVAEGELVRDRTIGTCGVVDILLSALSFRVAPVFLVSMNSPGEYRAMERG